MLEKHFSSVIRRSERSEASSASLPNSSAASISKGTLSGLAAKASTNFVTSPCVSADSELSRIVNSGTVQEGPFLFARDSRLSTPSRNSPTCGSSFHARRVR